ncbi:hypothetical protein D3C77_548400 [compost metagenome]
MAGAYLAHDLGRVPGLALEVVAGEVDKAPVGLKTAPMAVNPLRQHILGNEGHQGRDPLEIVWQGLGFALIPEVEGRKLLKQAVIEHERPPCSWFHPTPIYAPFLPRRDCKYSKLPRLVAGIAAICS